MFVDNLERIMLAMILVLIALATVPTALCHSFGVKTGDWIEYDLQEFSGEHTQRIDFTSVMGTALTLNITDTMPSGLEFNPTTGDINLTNDDDFSAGMNFLTARVLVIPNDTSIGDSVYLGNEFGNRTISDETTKAYAGVDRRVIHANFTLQQNQKRYTLYWDKQTGVLVEATMSYGYMYSSLSTVDTNMWIGGIGWWFWIIIATVIACGIISTKRKAIKKLWRKPQTTGEATTK